jgi:sugar phosphate isomerase/epimerase
MTTPVAVQLYSLREEAQRDVFGVIERLGKLGVQGVETAGLHGLRPADFRRAVGNAGMTVCSAHGPLPLGPDANRILDEQQELGNDALVVPYLPIERFRDEAALAATADDLNRAAESAVARGMTLGYHNHWWEVQSRLGEQTALERLFGLLAPPLFAEIDSYWAKVGGVDPAELVVRLGERVRYLHLKDGPADGPDSAMVALGDGVLDVPAVVRAGASVAWHIIELDRCDTDMFEAIEKSYRYLLAGGLAEPRS